MTAASIRNLLGLCLGVGLWFHPDSLSAAPPPKPLPLNWRYIHYESVEIPSAPGEKLSVVVGSQLNPELTRLRCDVQWTGRDPATPPQAIMEPGRIKVRLHPRTGSAVEPTPPLDTGPVGISMTGATTYGWTFQFPWLANELAESWLEVRVDGRAYWCELPYGLARDPAAPPPPTEAEAGPPALAPAMAKLAPEDRIVPWSKIDYDLGEIQQGWRLWLEVLNVPDARWLVTLYREVGQWTLETPRISVEWAVPGGETLTPQWLKGRLALMFRRTDEYRFPANAVQGRAWGTLTIGVDQHLTKVGIPSSLFRDSHGTAEPAHAQRLRIDFPPLPD